MGDAEFRQQLFQRGLEQARFGFDQLGGGADVLLGSQAAEDGSLLRQITDAQSRAAVHGQAGHVVAVDSMVPPSTGMSPVIM